MRTVSIFSSYKQENQFTNGLVALLKLSKKEKPQFPNIVIEAKDMEEAKHKLRQP